jgi:multidrug efflux pump subunit AcrB
MSIGNFSVKNPVLLNILFVLLLVLGYFSISRLPREQFSEVPFYFVNIVVPYPGVSAEDVEREVTINIEKEMQGLDELQDEDIDEFSSNDFVPLIEIALSGDLPFDSLWDSPPSA